MMLFEGMPLHPISVAVVFVIFAVLCVFTMVSMVKQRKMALAGFMFLSAVVMVASAVISAQVSAT
ncbi:hypothetical protein [Tumebacillus lipolyticus]|uniref:DUF2759 domain-containing protein n=1 Tax=Tumebacillus lipolyticus TaxID=1280370 RepID=A0ABW4ZXF4_9BACL